MIEHSAELGELAAALNKAQMEIAVAKKGSQNPFFRSTYADLASVWEACREPLTKNGLSVAQFPGFVAGNPPTATVTTVLLHISGQYIAAEAGAPLPDQKRKDGSEEKANAQGVGSAITYLRRYALAAVASVSPADDDGNAASGTKAERGRTSTAPAKGSAARATSAPAAPMPPLPIEPLSVTPRAILAAQAEPAPWDGPDYGEPVHQDEQVRVFYAARRAGIMKKDFEGWYEKVRGRPWRQCVRLEDLEPLTKAAEARIAEIAGKA